MLDEALRRAKAGGTREQLDFGRDVNRRLPASSHLEGDHSAGPFEMPLCQVVLGVGFETRVVHRVYDGMRFEKARHLHRVVGVTAHPISECLQTTIYEPAIERRRYRPFKKL